MLCWDSADPAIVTAFQLHTELISGETLAIDTIRQDTAGATPVTINGAPLRIDIELRS